jgi:type II secretory pathway pseudopilin PulG
MRRDRGFMLLEMLIAFAIAAMALAVLVRGAMAGLGTASVAGHYEEALTRARSRLAAAGAHLVAADNGGGFHWRVRIAPLAATTAGSDAASGPDAGRVTLFSVGSRFPGPRAATRAR